MEQPIEFLASRRSRRSTAGNRMQAALAEVVVEDTAKDVEDDVDFTVEKDEQDVFESDFESTDEEQEAKEDEGPGEKEVNEEEMKERSAARSKLEKATAAAHARNRATFNPEAMVAPKPKPKARIQVFEDEILDASTSVTEASPKRKRKSTRTQTVLNTSATVERLKELRLSKSSEPRKARSKAKMYTQAELIARALDNEEGNIREHRDYLKNEEERRKKAQVVRPSVSGPALRWVSKVEDEKVLVPPAPDFQFTGAQPPSVFGNIIPQSMLQPEPAEPQYKMEKVGKNYLVHKQGTKKPTWKQSMQAMFGKEVKWDEVKVYSTKNRPYERPVQVCPFTGKVAPYMDPQTGIPFANVSAFIKSRETLRHEYVWDNDMGCYVAKEEEGHDAMVEG